MKQLLATLVAAGLTFLGGAATAEPVTTPHVTTELVARTGGAAPASTLYVAVVITAAKGWHTYWRNPGDAGEATTVAWTLPAGWTAGDIVWPTPRRLPVGPIMDYGYEGRAVLPVPIHIPADVRPGAFAKISAAVDYLVCAQVCVPGSAKVDLALPIVAGAPARDPVGGPLIQSALASAPRSANLTATFQYAAARLTLAVVGDAVTGRSDQDIYFYPYSDATIEHAKPQRVERGPNGLTLTLAPGAAFTGTAPRPDRITGALALGHEAFEVTAAAGPPPAGASGFGSPASGGSGLSLPVAVGLAFTGGLILNLMPCVFPILSMKAAALSRHASAGRAPVQGLAFLCGVLVTFGALAGILIAARAAGQAIGWGFQLQSPLVVAALALLMLAAALNLSGLYEVGGSVQGLGSGLHVHGETLGSVLTGVLAVIVAAPCTAPFMGPALGYALTQSTPVALAIFAGLGVGFAAPFALLTFSPALLRRLPRPGPWMDGVKKALAFPMYASAAWLLWVLAQQTDSAGLARVLIAAVVFALGAWLVGVAQKRHAVGAPGLLVSLLAGASLTVSAAAIFAGPYAAPAAAPTRSAGALSSTPFSPDRLASLRAAGRPVLVNFTAAWCVTCQVNERVAFSSPDVARAIERTGAAYMVADWTNRDAAIARALADQGRIGVPLYLLYRPGAWAPTVLPQLLTPQVVVQALNQATRKPALGA